MPGKLISLEGIDNTGKSTQARRLSLYLKRKGFDTLLIREPGGTEISEKIRRILLSHKSGSLSPRAELLLYQAARAQLVSQMILPALRLGKIVVCDRYYDSSTAYQGYARGLDLKLVRDLNKFATGGIAPDLTILIDLPAQLALKRAKGNLKSPDRLEKEKLRFHEKVRAGYLSLAKKEPARFKIIKGDEGIEKIWQKIRCVVDKMFKLK